MLIAEHFNIRTLQFSGRRDQVGPSSGEDRRIDVTIHSLTSIDDEFRRQRTLAQLNRKEDQHSLARAVFSRQAR